MSGKRPARKRHSPERDSGTRSKTQVEQDLKRLMHRPAARIGEIKHGKG
jgi:hypothetical protein